MNDVVSQILPQIEEFCQRTGISESMLCVKAVNDARFIDRLRDGGRVTVKNVDKLLATMQDMEQAQ